MEDGTGVREVMKIVYAAEFKKRFAEIPAAARIIYRRQEAIFIQNWRDPRLHLKKLSDHPFPFSFRITRNYRVLFMFVDQHTALFATIGHRKDVYR